MGPPCCGGDTTAMGDLNRFSIGSVVVVFALCALITTFITDFGAMEEPEIMLESSALISDDEVEAKQRVIASLEKVTTKAHTVFVKMQGVQRQSHRSRWFPIASPGAISGASASWKKVLL